MKSLFLTLLLAASPAAAPALAASEPPAGSATAATIDPASAPLAPLTVAQQRDLSCATSFAITAAQQQAGIDHALAYPPLARRGRAYMRIVGERIMAETGRSREQVGQEIRAIAAVQQAKSGQGSAPLASPAFANCLATLDQQVPPPTLNQCAIATALAYEKAYRSGADSDTAADLKNHAATLDLRARAQLKADGYSDSDGDILLEKLRAEMRGQTDAAGELVDIDQCIELATVSDGTNKDAR